jgi:hypothetical protein
MSDELPQGWATVPLGELTEPTRPRRNPAEHLSLPFVGAGAIGTSSFSGSWQVFARIEPGKKELMHVPKHS